VDPFIYGGGFHGATIDFLLSARRDVLLFPEPNDGSRGVVLGAGNLCAVCSAITIAPHEYFYRRSFACYCPPRFIIRPNNGEPEVKNQPRSPSSHSEANSSPKRRLLQLLILLTNSRYLAPLSTSMSTASLTVRLRDGQKFLPSRGADKTAERPCVLITSSRIRKTA